MGKALLENWNLEVSFAKSFFKHVLGKPIYIEDMEDMDDEMKDSLVQLLNEDMKPD